MSVSRFFPLDAPNFSKRTKQVQPLARFSPLKRLRAGRGRVAPFARFACRKSPPRRGGGDIDFAVFYILPPCQPYAWGKMATRQNRVFSPLRGVASHAPCRAPRLRRPYPPKIFRIEFSLCIRSEPSGFGKGRKAKSELVTAPCGWARPMGKRPSRAQARAERCRPKPMPRKR